MYLDRTGFGVLGDRMFSPTWFIEGEESIRNPGIRTLKYWPDLGGETDIVFLLFTFKGCPGYLVRMLLVPSWLFLLVSYTGFFIEPNSAPARAAVALLPVLIMRSLQGFVFSKLPEVATSVWLIDYLLGSMIMCCYAAVHLAAVQLLLSRKRKAAENLTRLRNVEGTARKLIEESNKKKKKKKKFVAALLSDYTPTITNHLAWKMSYLAKKAPDAKTEAPAPRNRGRAVSYCEMTSIASERLTSEDTAQKIPLLDGISQTEAVRSQEFQCRRS